ncbi:MAG: hypothetical protein GY855_15480 [candidate division Zixibacteria bacterium]|nr:hypothetical protein [candidate division Zixibacteria bacterium]
MSFKSVIFTKTGLQFKFFSMVLVLFSFIPIAIINAGVLVAPTVVFLYDNNRTGRITLQNTSNESMEAEVLFSYGLPVSDSLGNVEVNLNDSLITDPRSALGWVRSFPRKVIIGANNSQVVRILASPPQNLPDGEYWARILIRSIEAQPTIPTSSEGEDIQTQLNMVVQTAISLKYRTGNLMSNLELSHSKASLVNSKVRLLLDMFNRGNVSYLGVIKARLLDANNKEMSATRLITAVYRSLRKKVMLQLPENINEFQKPYRIEFEISTDERSDVPPGDVVPGNSINQTVIVG